MNHLSSDERTKIKEVKKSGMLIFDLSVDEPILSVTDFISFIKLDRSYSFKKVNSSHLSDKVVTRYQQYFNGIEVENGGFAIITGGN